jgi:hypothetical protein
VQEAVIEELYVWHWKYLAEPWKVQQARPGIQTYASLSSLTSLVLALDRAAADPVRFIRGALRWVVGLFVAVGKTFSTYFVG